MASKEILERWSTADAFYRERDERTLRVVGGLHAYVNRTVEVWVDPDMATDATVQSMTLVAANLTARWAHTIRVVVPTGVVLTAELWRDGETTLAGRLMREMSGADPFGDFAVVAESAMTGDTLRLFIGPWRWATGAIRTDDYVIHAESWTALGRRGGLSVGMVGHSIMPGTVAAAGLAAALGAADLFKRAIGHSRERWMPTFAWDTWSSHFRLGAEAWVGIEQRCWPARLEFGNTLLAGVGAVGSAFLYLSDLMPMDGALTPFDRDSVEITNLNRSPMFTVAHALRESAKTTAAAEYLAHRTVKVTPLDGIWREHSATLGMEPFDVWISLTNEDGAWAEVPFQLPPIVLHGTTTSGWGFGTGRHIPRIEDCTLCRMPRPAAEFRGRCAEGEVARVDSEEIRASLPFLSTAAAALLVASYLQLQCGAQAVQLANDICVDLGVGLPAVIAIKRPASDGCRGCHAAMSRVWAQRGGRGRFAMYSLLDEAEA